MESRHFLSRLPYLLLLRNWQIWRGLSTRNSVDGTSLLVDNLHPSFWKKKEKIVKKRGRFFCCNLLISPLPLVFATRSSNCQIYPCSEKNCNITHLTFKWRAHIPVDGGCVAYNTGGGGKERGDFWPPTDASKQTKAEQMFWQLHWVKEREREIKAHHHQRQ